MIWIELYEDKADQWRFRFVATNGRKLATSGESFSGKFEAERAAKGLVEDITEAYVDGTGAIEVRVQERDAD